jgi:hypothetical protein
MTVTQIAERVRNPVQGQVVNRRRDPCEANRHPYVVNILRKSVCCHFSLPGRVRLSDAMQRFIRLFHNMLPL